MAEADTRNPASSELVAVLDGHATANAGTLSGSDLTPAADSLPGARAGADASGRAHHPPMAETEATNPAYPELTAAVVDGDAPAAGGSPE